MFVRTVDVVGGIVNQIIVVYALSPCAAAYPAETRDNILSHATVLRELLTQLLDHAVDVVQLGLLTCRGGHAAHAGRHVAAVHSVHEYELLVLCVGEGLLGGCEGARCGVRWIWRRRVVLWLGLLLLLLARDSELELLLLMLLLLLGLVLLLTEMLGSWTRRVGDRVEGEIASG